MIAVAAATPTGPTTGPVPIPGGDAAQAVGADGDEQPTFDHVLAHEAQADTPSPRGSGDGPVSKGRDPREAGPHKDTGSAAAAPPNPALFVQLLPRPESRPTVGGSAPQSSTGAPARHGSEIPSSAISPNSGPDPTISSGTPAGRGPVSTRDTVGAFLPAGATAPSGTIGSADSGARSEATLTGKNGDSTGPVNPGERLANVVQAITHSDILARPETEAVKSSLTPEAAPSASNVTPWASGSILQTDRIAPLPTRQSASPPADPSRSAVTPLSITALSQTGLSFRQAPVITATTAAATAPRGDLLSGTRITDDGLALTDLLPSRAGDTPSSPEVAVSVRPTEVAGTGAPVVNARSVSPPENQRVAEQIAASTAESNENVDKPHAVTSSAADKGLTPTTNQPNQPAWSLNPMITAGQSFAPARSSRAVTAQSLAPLAATPSTADRVRATDSNNAAPSGDRGTAPTIAGLPVVNTGPSYAQAAGGQSAHTAGTSVGTALYQPIAQRVLVHGASLQVAGASSSFNVVLNPRSLGMVTIHVARGQEGLQVTITPQQTDTTALLNKHLPDLVGMLKQGGQDLAVQAQVVQTHSVAPTHNGTPQAAAAGQSGLNMSMNTGGQTFTGQQGNTEQGAWAATANDLFGVADRGTGEVGPEAVVVQARVGGAARVDIQA